MKNRTTLLRIWTSLMLIAYGFRALALFQGFLYLGAWGALSSTPILLISIGSMFLHLVALVLVVLLFRWRKWPFFALAVITGLMTLILLFDVSMGPLGFGSGHSVVKTISSLVRSLIYMGHFPSALNFILAILTGPIGVVILYFLVRPKWLPSKQS